MSIFSKSRGKGILNRLTLPTRQYVYEFLDAEGKLIKCLNGWGGEVPAPAEVRDFTHINSDINLDHPELDRYVLSLIKQDMVQLDLNNPDR